MSGPATLPPRDRRLRRPTPLRRPARLAPLRERDTAPVVDHLEELRWRVAIVFAVLIAGMVVCYAEFERLSRLLEQPLGGDGDPGATVVEFRVPAPVATPEPTWLALTASTTSGVLADHLVGLFDAVASTLRWTT